MADNNVNITKSDIKHIICTGELPLSTEKDKVRITYRVLSDIFSVIDEESLSPKDVIVPCLTLLCGWDVSNVVGKPSNFLRSKSRKINNKKKLVNLDDIVPEFTLQSENTDQPSSFNFLGKYCEKFSIKKDIFDKILEGKKDISKVLLSNGALLELEMERSKRNLTWKSFSQIITALSDIPDTSHLTDDFLRHRINSLQEQKHTLVGKKINVNVENVLDKTFSYEKHIPLPASAATTFVKIADNQKVEMLLLKISDLENKLSNVCEALAEENAERLHLQSEVKTLHKEYKVLSLELKKKKKRKVGQVYTKKC